ncbi:MAG: hypothetical protein AAFU79_12435 [Myxococcota bacterium]
MKRNEGIPRGEILSLLRGRLSPSSATELRDRIREDEAARAMYDRLATAEAMLHPGALEERVEARVLGTIPRRRSAPRVWMGWGVLSAAAAALALSLPFPASETGGYARRGDPNLDGDHVLQVLRARVGADDRLTIEPATEVRPGDPLRFAVASRARDALVSVLAVAGNARTVLEPATSLPRGSQVRRLDLSFRAPDDLQTDLRIVAVFSHGGPDPELSRIDLQPRDTDNLSVRVLTLELEAQP